jgi:hypothetical protein
MALDHDRLLAAEIPERRSAWTPQDVILYQLGVGAGARPEDLGYVYERGLKVLPSFGVVPAQHSWFSCSAPPALTSTSAMSCTASRS